MIADVEAPITTTTPEDHCQRVNTIVIVGGGDNGLLTALGLERLLKNVEITVIDDDSKDGPRVGKSTLTFFVQYLHDVLGIKGSRLIQEVPIGFKTSVYFKDWCGVDSFHSPLGWSIPVVASDRTDSSVSHTAEDIFDEYFYRYRECEFSGIYEEIAETPGKTPFKRVNGKRGPPMRKELVESAYHINTDSFNKFLREICIERGIEFVNDRIESVETSDGCIERIVGSLGQLYVGDLYLDASGFNRVLLSALDVDVYRPDIPVDSAVKTQVDLPLNAVESATVVTTGKAGWFWQIDTMGGRDIGYVYSSDHLSPQEAKREMIDSRPEQIDLGSLETLSWNPGIVTKPWRTNCVAVGNSLAFIEPLHSFTLTASASLAYILADLLGKYGRINHPNLRALFNDGALCKWREIYAYQSTLYKYNSGDTPFWQDARNIDIETPDQLYTYYNSGFASPTSWDRLTRTDTDQNPYYLYFLLFRSLGIDSPFFDKLDIAVDPDVIDEIRAHRNSLPERVETFLDYDDVYRSYGLDYD